QVQRRERVFGQQVLSALECALGSVQSVRTELRDTEPEPIFPGAAEGDELGQYLLRLSRAPMPHQFLSVDATTVEVVLVFFPVLLEAREKIVQADRQRTPLLILNLNGRTIETEQLPHLF